MLCNIAVGNRSVNENGVNSVALKLGEAFEEAVAGYDFAEGVGKILEVFILDVLNNQEKLQKELFAPAEVLLEIDPKQAEKEALKKRLAELENNG